METEAPDNATPAVEVFWRPGCPYCSDLRGLLLDYEVEAQWRNIWNDNEAAAIVRTANCGNETVPTVRIGDLTLTNPTWRQLAEALGRDYRQPPPPVQPRPYASAGSCTPHKPASHRDVLSAGMLLTGGVVVLVDLLGTSWASNHLADGHADTLGAVTLQIAHNRGISWGLLGGHPAFALISSILGLLVLAFLIRITPPAVRTALVVATAGGLANLLDRLVHGSVTDWIHLAGYGPTFNLADIAVRGGLVVAAAIALWPRTRIPSRGKRAYRTPPA